MVLESDPEPEHKLLEEREINVFASAVVAFAKYECSIPDSVRFLDTYMFQTRTYR